MGGIVILDHVREIIFKPELYEITPVNTLMFMPETTIEIGESMNDVAQKFYNSDKFNLVVLDQGKYVGFISRARVFFRCIGGCLKIFLMTNLQVFSEFSVL